MIKIITGHPNYAVSDKGKIYRITKDGYRELKEDHSHKYPTVKLDNKNYYVQKIVGKTFVPRYHEDQTVIVHADKDLENNSASNLVWVSPSECQRVIDWDIYNRIHFLKEKAKNKEIL